MVELESDSLYVQSLFRGDEYSLKLTTRRNAQFSKKSLNVYSKWMSCVVCKFYLNKVDFKKNDPPYHQKKKKKENPI